MKGKKILILYNKLFHYRVPIFNIIANKYDLTVVYSYKTTDDLLSQCYFKTKYVPIIKIWKFVFHKANISKIANDYDVVIAYGQTSWISYSSLALKKNKNYKILFWSIGAPASYKRKYGEGSKLYYMFNDFFDKRADGLIFYSQKSLEMHVNRGFNTNKMFVANNTVEVLKTEIDESIKNKILFIGTLYLEKGLDILLQSYFSAYKKNVFIPELNIVGGGEQYDIILKWVKDNNLCEKVHLLGPIYDEIKKSKLFSESIACISPLQAGLSVLESMGYGVPYITMKDAITGGEAFNIENNVTGLRLYDITQFKDVILDISNNREKYINMGNKAYEYYWQNRKPEDMANGIIEAIESVSKINN